MKKTIIGLAALAMLTGTAGLAAAGDANLEAQIHRLIEQNKQLTERVMNLEQQIAGHGREQDVISREKTEGFAPVQSSRVLTERIKRLEEQVARQQGRKAEGKEGGEKSLQAINDHVELSALVEVEASSWNDNDGRYFYHRDDDDGSDVTLATVEIGLDARISEWSSAHILLLYEEGEENDHIIIDEGTITLGNMDKFPLYLTAGRMYVPFGCFETFMISDPLTLEMGETNDSTVLIGFESSSFRGSVYALNGDIGEEGDGEINTYGAALGYVYAGNEMNFDLSIHYISNIANSDGISEHLAGRQVADPEQIENDVDGFSAHAHIGIGPFTMIAEYLAALDDFEDGEIDFKNDGAEPESWNIELGFTTELFERETTFALGYQGTDEAAELELPEDLYIGSITTELFEHTSLAFEYFHAEDYDINDGGSDDEADVVTMQLAVEF